MFVVCCWLFVVSCTELVVIFRFVVRCLMLPQLYVVCCCLSVFGCVLLFVCCWLCLVVCLLFVSCRLLLSLLCIVGVSFDHKYTDWFLKFSWLTSILGREFSCCCSMLDPMQTTLK